MPRVLEKYNMKDLGSARAIKILMQENASLKNALPTAHISTTSTQLTDSADGMTIENVKIKGATEQVQYEGYNLLSSEFEQGARSNSDGITLITSNQYVRSKNKIVVQPNTSYIVALNGQLKSGNAMFYNDENFISQTSLTESFTTPNSCNKIHVQFYDSTGISVETMGYAQLNIGSTIKPYEPYVGGQASPNPDFPQDIHVVTGNCNVKVENRNLFDASSIINNKYIGVKDGDIIYAKEGDGRTWSYANSQFKFTLTAGQYKISYFSKKIDTAGWTGFRLMNSSETYLTNVIAVNFESGQTSLELTDTTDIGIMVKLTNGEMRLQIEKGSTTSSYAPHAEQNAPLTLGNIEAYEGDEIQIDYVQKAGYKKVTVARLVKNNAKIASYNGETITTEYKSTTGQLTTGATVVYKLATPDITEITDQTLLAQLETLINMKTYKEVTNIDLTGEDLAPVLDCDYYQDMSTLNDRLDELEARIELLEE